ncbi:hypothetical protein JOM56_001302 [Amanita muscaria]
MSGPSPISSLVSSEGSAAKCARVSGPAAIVGLTNEMVTLNSQIRIANEHKAQQPEQLAVALNAAALNTATTAVVPYDAGIQTKASHGHVRPVSTDASQARMYTQIKRDSLRKKWIKRELQKVGCIIPDFADDSAGSTSQPTQSSVQ